MYLLCSQKHNTVASFGNNDKAEPIRMSVNIDRAAATMTQRGSADRLLLAAEASNQSSLQTLRLSITILGPFCDIYKNIVSVSHVAHNDLFTEGWAVGSAPSPLMMKKKKCNVKAKPKNTWLISMKKMMHVKHVNALK